MNSGNIQAHPTPSLYEKRVKGDIFVFSRAKQYFVLSSSFLRDIVYPVATKICGPVVSSVTLLSSVLRNVIVDVGVNVASTVSDVITLNSTYLRFVVVSFPTQQNKITSCSTSLLNSELKTVLVNFPSINAGNVNNQTNIQAGSLT